MKREKVIITILIMVSVLAILFVSKNIMNKNNQPEINKIKNNKTMAIMISEDGRKYTEYEGEIWPGTEYKYTKAECIDNNGKEIGEEVVTFDEDTRKATLKTNKTVYCTLYFDNKGTGEEDKPYRIQYIEDLVELQVAVNNGETYAGKYFSLERDLDFNKESDYRDYQSKEYGDINGNETDEELKTELTSGSGWVPIGYEDTNPFQGIFNGDSHTLANLYVKNDKLKRAGLFGYISNSTIENLKINGVVSSSITGTFGGLTGLADNTTKINNIIVNTNVSSNSENNSVGGIIGEVYGETTITNSINLGTIKNGNNTGGIVGYLASNSTLVLDNVENQGNVTNELGTNTGGLIGRDNAATSKIIIRNSTNNGVITNSTKTTSIITVGGLVGRVYGTIEILNSKNSNEVISPITEYDANINVGGLIGELGTHNNSISRITKSYNIGNINGGNRVGGLIGLVDSEIILYVLDSYNNGTISTSILKGTSGSNISVGGIIGYVYSSNCTLLNSYNSNKIEYTNNMPDSNVSGLIGYSSMNSTNKFINSYNIGVIENNSTGYANGLIRQNTGNLEFYNVYNGGSINGTENKTYGIGYYASLTPIENNLYYSNEVVGSNQNIGEGLTKENIKLQTFVDILNANLSKIDLNKIDENIANSLLNIWKLGTDNYPTFKGELIEDLSGNYRHV